MMVVIFAASSFPSADLPRFGWWDVIVKKGGHLLGYGLLALAYLRGLSYGVRITGRHVMLAVCLAGLYGATDEFHQLFVPGRGAMLTDVLIDTVGAVFGAGVRVGVRR
jgi:VanZ family protein